jgi:hypothetical protein
MTLFPNLKTWGRLSLLLVASSALVAQESGQISGTVKNTAGKPIANARVTIKAAQMIQPRTLVTGADGTYRAPLLPAGDYVVSATADGFISASATLRIGIGGRHVQDFPLKGIETKTAVVEVVAVASTADKADTKASANFSAAQLESLPASDRAFYGAAQLAPGVVTTATGSVSVRGATTQSTVYTLNGASIGDDYQGQQYENRIVDDAIEDVQVIQSPLNARFGRTSGGIINVASKSGGNDFTGSIRAYINRDDWRSWRPYERDSSEGRRNTYSNRQKDIFISGPIIKDRLWFAASAVITPPQVSTDTLLLGEDPSTWTLGYSFGVGEMTSVFGIPEVPMLYDLGKSVGVQTKADQYQGKLTFAINQDHTLEYEYYSRKLTTSNRNPYGIPIINTIQSNSLAQVDESKTNNFGYKGTIGSNVFVEARYTDATGGATFPAPPYPHVRWTTNSNSGVMFPYGFNTSPARDARDNRSATINVKAYLEAAGQHELDIGYDYYEFRRGTSTQNGALNRRFYMFWATPGATANAWLPATSGFGPVGTDPYGNSVGFFAMNLYDSAADIFGGNPGTNGISPIYQQYYGKDGLTTNANSAIYINDQWSINSHWNVMVGLRMDKMKVGDTNGSTIINRNAPISPRLMIRYDLNGDSSRLFTFTAAKYVDDIRAGFTDAFVSKANTRWARFGWSAFSGVDDYGFVSYSALVNPANYGGPKGLGTVPGGPYQVFDSSSAILGAKDITNPYTNELTFGYRRTYGNGSSLSLTAIHKEFKNQFATIQELDPSYFVMVSDPSGISTSQIRTLATRYGNSDLLTRRYSALEMEFTGRLSSVWTVLGSYTYGRLTGNTEGGDSLTQGFRDNTPSAPVYMRNWLTSSTLVGGGYQVSDFASDGALSSDRTHKLRVSTVARMPLGKGYVSYSFIGNYDSGQPYSAVANNSTQSSLVASPKPSLPLTFGRFYSQRGAFRFNDTYSVDFKLAYDAPLVSRLRLIGDFSVFNLFNHLTMYQWNAGYTTSTLARTAPIAVASRTNFGTDSGQYTNYAGRRSFSASIGLRF